MDRFVRGRDGKRGTRVSFGALLVPKTQHPCIAYTLAIFPRRRDTRQTREMECSGLGEGLTRHDIAVCGVLAQWSNPGLRRE